MRQDSELDGLEAALALKERVSKVQGGKERRLVNFAMGLLAGELTELEYDEQAFTNIELCATAMKLVLTKVSLLSGDDKQVLVLYCAEMAACGIAQTSEQAFAIATVFNLAEPGPFKRTNFQLKEMLSQRDETPLVNAMFCTFANRIRHLPEIKESLVTRFLTSNL